MQARAPLMKEHRLIERMLASIDGTIGSIAKTGQADPVLIDRAIDFVRTYADRTHHGKEEDILFKELSARHLSPDDQRVMDDLIAEHAFARKVTIGLAEANARYRTGDESALDVITRQLGTLRDFYPQHIAKEDKEFFVAARAYFTDEEDQAMLARFWDFDRAMIHEKYGAVVGELEGRRTS